MKVRFFLAESTLSIEYGFASLPVPAVVGTAITGRGRFTHSAGSNISSGNASSFSANAAIAFAASIALPPPMPITVSAPKARASFPARYALPTEGFSVTPSNTEYGIPAPSSTAVTSESAPDAFAPCFPVTINARFAAVRCSGFSAIAFFEIYISVGIFFGISHPPNPYMYFKLQKPPV